MVALASCSSFDKQRFRYSFSVTEKKMWYSDRIRYTNIFKSWNLFCHSVCTFLLVVCFNSCATFLQVVSTSNQHQSVSWGCLSDLNTCSVQALSLSLCLSKITQAHSTESLPPFPLPNPTSSAGICTNGSPEMSSPVASPGTICIIPHSAWQGPLQLPHEPLQQLLGGRSSPALFSLPRGDRGYAPILCCGPLQKSSLAL